MVYSASALVALERYQEPYRFLTKQLMWATLGSPFSDRDAD
jgi:cell division protein FtsW (lipid II flippase)